MIRGTTPIHFFTLPFNADGVEKVRVIYSQKNLPIFKKELADCVLNGNVLSVKLTQEDTLKLNHEFNVDIQVRILMKSGDALASLPIKASVQRCLEDEVI